MDWPSSSKVVEVREIQVYDFWAEKGQFKWLNTKRIPGPRDVLEIRSGSARLLRAPQWVAGVYRAIYGAFLVAGAALGSLSYWAASAASENVFIRVFAFSASVVLVGLALAIMLRGFFAFAARHSPKPGLEVHVTDAEYHRFYHQLVVNSEEGEFKLTIGGLRRRVVRALALSR